MKKLSIFLCFIVFGVSSAFGQNGAIGVFADQAGTDPCGLADKAPGVKNYYVVHVYALGATASQFMARAPWCLRGQHLADITPFPVVFGSSQYGIAINYGSCRTGSFPILTMVFLTTGLTPDCCCWDVTPDPAVPSGRIEVADCDYNLTYGTGGRGIINSTVDCQCFVCASPACLQAFYAQRTGCLLPVPADEDTWGRVKQLYSD